MSRNRATPLPSQEILLETFEYRDGQLYRKVGQNAGKLTGSDDGHGYLIVCVKGKKQRAHRVIWKMFHGVDPVHCIDHIDGDRSNNRIENLQDIPAGANSRKGIAGKGKHLPGVNATKSGFTARMWFEGERFYLGSFKTEQEAHEAYLSAMRDTNQQLPR